MIKKSIIGIIALILVIAGVALVFANSQNHTNSTNSIQTQQNTSVNNSTTNNSTSHKKDLKNTSVQTDNTKIQIKISTTEAKKIAQQADKIPGETAGTPQLTKENGKYIYVVPIFKDGKKVACIGVDPNTGDTSEL